MQTHEASIRLNLSDPIAERAPYSSSPDQNMDGVIEMEVKYLQGQR